MRWTVYIDSHPLFHALTEEDGQTVLDAAMNGNRWFTIRRHDTSVTSEAGLPDEEPVHKKLFWWNCIYSEGNSGWDASPFTLDNPPPDEEAVLRRTSTKQAVVQASSAIYAIERAKLLCLSRST